MNGVTGRMGYRQHLVRSILAIREQGGVPLGDGERVLARAGPGRPQRGQAGRARRAARHRRLHHRPRRRPGRPALRDLLRRPGDQGPRRRRSRKAIAAGKHDLHREADRRDAATSALELAARSPGPPGIKHGVVQDKLYLPGLHKLKRLIDGGLLRPHPVGARRVRLLGLRGRLAARPAAELELPRRGRRRHRRGHVPALELRAGEPVRPGRVGLRARRHAHPDRASDEAGHAYAGHRRRRRVRRSSSSTAASSPQINSSLDACASTATSCVEFQVDGTARQRRRRACATAGSSTATPPRSRCGTRTSPTATTTRADWHRGARQRGVRQRLQGAVGAVPPPRRRGRPARRSTSSPAPAASGWPRLGLDSSRDRRPRRPARARAARPGRGDR